MFQQKKSAYFSRRIFIFLSLFLSFNLEFCLLQVHFPWHYNFLLCWRLLRARCMTFDSCVCASRSKDWQHYCRWLNSFFLSSSMFSVFDFFFRLFVILCGNVRIIILHWRLLRGCNAYELTIYQFKSNNKDLRSSSFQFACQVFVVDRSHLLLIFNRCALDFITVFGCVFCCWWFFICIVRNTAYTKHDHVPSVTKVSTLFWSVVCGVSARRGLHLLLLIMSESLRYFLVDCFFFSHFLNVRLVNS